MFYFKRHGRVRKVTEAWQDVAGECSRKLALDTWRREQHGPRPRRCRFVQTFKAR